MDIHASNPELRFRGGLIMPSGKSKIVHYWLPPVPTGCCTFAKYSLTAHQRQARTTNVSMLAVEYRDWLIPLRNSHLVACRETVGEGHGGRIG